MERDVFISYRRADTSGHAGRISDDLERHFGAGTTFRDIDSIGPGTDFVRALEGAIDGARVCIVLIGDTWLTEQMPDGSRRLDAAEDHVRREVELALGSDDLLVVPVLVEGAQMPSADELPASLQRLARLQAVELSESRWDYDMARLIGVLRVAGVAPPRSTRLPRWLIPLLAVIAVAAVAAGLYCWRTSSDAIDHYTGLWHLPNGSFWSVREKGAGLWVEETHYDSRQVWKRGPAEIDDGELTVALELVFEQEPFRYLHRLSLAQDRQSLVGSVRRSDREAERSLVLTRTRP